MAKIKTYVITVSERFPHFHFKAGEETKFVDKILRQIKIHTIRRNYEFWKKRVDKINEGKAILSIRVWTGKPYNSKQHEVAIFTRLGIEHITSDEGFTNVKIGGVLLQENESLEVVAAHDGLTLEEVRSWLKEPILNGAIIHFTAYKYDPIKIDFTD